MHERLLFAAQVLFYAALPITFATLRSSMRVTFLYVYVGVVLVIGGFLGAVYAFPLTDDITISGGSIAYGALLLSSILLVIVGNDLQVVRNVIKIVIAVNVFKFGLFWLSAAALESSRVLNPLGTAPEVFSVSIRSVAAGGVLIIGELLLLVAVFERVKVRSLSRRGQSVFYVLGFIAVLGLDGVLFPLFALTPTAGIADVIVRGVQAKLVLAVSFSVPLIGFLVLFRTTVDSYEAAPIRMVRLIRPRMHLERVIERQEKVLQHHVSHDDLTGLANRTLLVERIEQAIAERAAGDGGLAVLFLDLDDFKTVNDGHGHRVGDSVLLAVGRRIDRCLDTGALAARIGGDEFAVLLAGVGAPTDPEEIGTRMLDLIREPITVGADTITVHASMGIAFASGRTEVQAEDLLHHADLAMYRAKAGGKSRFMIYEPSMHQAVIERATLIAELRTGLDRHEFAMHYQPIVDLRSGRVIAVEALVRWQHPKHGLLPPAAFIGLAEESDLIVQLGAQALVDACSDVASWRDLRFADLRAGPLGAGAERPTGGGPAPALAVTVNLSTRQFQEPDLVDIVVAALRTSGLPAHLLTLEITESNFMVDVDRAIATLRLLKALGVHVSIDDFGTGFSSLSYLQRLPVDALKIDKSFVDRVIAGNDDDIALTRSIIGLGASLNLAVIAEGIELAEQRELLIDLRCPFGQGYYFARPMSREAAEHLLVPVPVT